MTFYRFAQRLVRAATRVFATRVAVEGLANVPASGPALLAANHESFIDAPILQAFCPRVVHAMAKSTEFDAPLFGPLLRRLEAFPVRRFEVDPQAVRVALRTLRRGAVVSIYPEGERSWDGRLQPPRLGTLRLILKAGVPVIPCAVLGAYEVLPRWGGGVRRGPLTIRFGQPLRFPQLDDRAARDAALPRVEAELMSALATVTGKSRPPSIFG